MRIKLLSLFILLTPLTAVHATTKATALQSEGVINLPVPHIWEIPDGVWVRPWNNACEEASLMMVEEFYLGRKEENVSGKEIKAKLTPLFAWQDRVFGSNADSDSKRTARIINEYSSFEAIIKQNPTLEEIKAELDAGHPVISFHYAKGMNPDHRFRAGGSYYHVMVITGYDDATQEFMLNDSEFQNGLDYRYGYATIMDTLHDFDHTRRKADGPPVVIFTRAKQLVKAAGKSAVYLVRDNKKQYISHPRVFKNRRWSWNAIITVEADRLSGLEKGPTISN